MVLPQGSACKDGEERKGEETMENRRDRNLPASVSHHPSHLPNLLPLAPVLNSSGYARHAILKSIGQALQAVAYSFGACRVVDGLPNATPSCADYAAYCA